MVCGLEESCKLPAPAALSCASQLLDGVKVPSVSRTTQSGAKARSDIRDKYGSRSWCDVIADLKLFMSVRHYTVTGITYSNNFTI